MYTEVYTLDRLFVYRRVIGVRLLYKLPRDGLNKTFMRMPMNILSSMNT